MTTAEGRGPDSVIRLSGVRASVNRFSGVWLLNTGVIARLRSGVFGLGSDEGPETTRTLADDLRLISCGVFEGDREGGAAVTVAERGREKGTLAV